MLQTIMPVVAVQPPGAWMFSIEISFSESIGVFILYNMIDAYIHIQVGVIIVVEKICHRALCCIRKAVLSSHIFKYRNAIFIGSLVYIQNVDAFGSVALSRSTNIHVHFSVIVNINDSNTAAPIAAATRV